MAKNRAAQGSVMICPRRRADNWARGPAGRSIAKAAVSGANVPVPGIFSGCDDAANAWIASVEERGPLLRGHDTTV